MTISEILTIGEKESEQVRIALKSARSTTDLLKITHEFHLRIENVFLALLKESNRSIACQSGCSFCCYIKVDAQPCEIFWLMHYIQKNFSKEQIEEIKTRAEGNRQKIVRMSIEEQMSTNICCPILRSGECICYNARPVMCRKHHVQNVSGCRRAFECPAIEVPTDGIAEIEYTMAAIITMTQTAWEKEGFDSRAYDLSSALSEALSNPKCERRWRDKKSAFSKTSLAKEPPQAFEIH